MADSATETKFMEGTQASGSGFPENYVNKIFIDIDPKVNSNGDVDINNVDNGKWAWLAGGINSMTPTANETSTTDYYYDGGGFGDNDVTGKQVTIPVSGNRKLGDPAQEFVAGKFWQFGNAVRTRIIWIDNDKPVIAQATLTNITPTGGIANAKQTFSFTISFNGRPKVFNGQLTMTATAEAAIYTASVDPSVKADEGKDYVPAKIVETVPTNDTKDNGGTQITTPGSGSQTTEPSTNADGDKASGSGTQA